MSEDAEQRIIVEFEVVGNEAGELAENVLLQDYSFKQAFDGEASVRLVMRFKIADS